MKPGFLLYTSIIKQSCSYIMFREAKTYPHSDNQSFTILVLKIFYMFYEVSTGGYDFIKVMYLHYDNTD